MPYRIAFMVVLACACGSDPELAVYTVGLDAVSEAPIRDGDPVLGRSLLLNNGSEDAPYLSCGVPRAVLDSLRSVGFDPFANAPKLPERERGNAELGFNFSYARTPAGVEVVTTNCLLCHASKLGDSLIVGLGNPNMNFTADGGVFGLPGIALELLKLGSSQAELHEFERFERVTAASSGWARPDTIGLNPADMMFGVLASHRDPETLEWRDTPDPAARFDVATVFTDVPAWWNLHRRDRMFYSGFGRGDHARIMMTTALLCLEDTAEAEAIDAYFPHVQAFIRSLRPPRYEDVAKRAVDQERAARGRTVFTNVCVGCHGDAEQGLAPRPSVGVDEVGTDPLYAISSSAGGAGGLAYYFEFFNRSWYGTHGAAARLEQGEQPGYSPPPLDGVWATAPYFHNGSVPTLEAVLDPSLRPAIFRRSFVPEQYDFERLGWPFESVASKDADVEVYDTTRPAFGNGGHTFAAQLSADERRDLLEYLKTL